MDTVSTENEELRRLREENAALAEKLRAVNFLFERNPLACFISDDETLRILDANDAAVRKYGYSRDEFLQMTTKDLRPVHEIPRYLTYIQSEQGRRSIYKGEWLHLTKDGRTLNVEVFSNAFDYHGRSARLVAIHDHTERKQAERALYEEERRLRLALDSSQLGIFDWNMVTGKVFWNNHLAAIYGLKLEEFDGTYDAFRRRVHPDDIEQVEREMNEALQHRTQFKNFCRIILPDGTIRFVQGIGCHFFEGDTPVRTLGVVRDVTDEVAARQKLSELDRFNAALVENTPSPIFATDREGRHIVANRKWEEMFGMPRAQALGKKLDELFAAADAQRFHETNREVFETGKTFHFEETVDTAIGRRVLQTHKFPVFNEDGVVRAVAGIAMDITELRQLQEEQIRNSKLEAVGRLAGGIAHDFNNLLVTILGNVSLTRQMLAGDPRFDRRLETVERACRRAAGLTQQLLTFAKGGSPVRSATSLPELIQETVEFALLGTGIQADYNFPDDLRDGHIDAGQIGQVFQNLTLNARDAMPDGGRISLSAVNVSVSDSEMIRPGEYVRLTFEDTGEGMTETELGSLFEPYFTTKATGNGLGLAVVQSIIKRHDGYISVTSRKGVGTVFTIHLPASLAVERETGPRPIRKTDTEEPDFSGLRILVMDDEAAILSFLEDSLVEMGFLVTTVQNGEAALEAFSEVRKTGRRFHLGIFDVTIRGGMGGRETLQNILRIDPAFRAIVASGFSSDGVVADFRSFGFRAALSKPFSMEDLRDAVLTVLGLKTAS